MNIALSRDAAAEATSKQMPVNQSMLCRRYTQEHILGVGGMGVVYRGVDTMLQALGATSNYIAIKMSCAEQEDNPSMDDLLFTEYEIASRLKHPNLVAIRHFDVCRQQQKAFLIMDWVEGSLLEELFCRQSIPPDIALHLSRQLVDAVHYCHQQGVVHGDIKPTNIIISPNNHLTLFDFGVSRWLYQPVATRRHAIRACSCRYAAPELFEEHIPTMASDVFAACCVIYRLFSGEHPFQDTTDEASARGDVIKPIFNRRHLLDKSLRQGLRWSHKERSCNLGLLADALWQLTPDDFKTGWFY